MVRKPVRKSRTKPVRRSSITWHKIMSKYSQGVIIINGHRGEGKSALGWDLAQKLHQKTNKPVSALGLPRTVREHFPKRGFGKGGTFSSQKQKRSLHTACQAEGRKSNPRHIV